MAAVDSTVDHNCRNLCYRLINFSSKVLQYIGGFVVKAAAKSVSCTTCMSMLFASFNTDANLIFITINFSSHLNGG